MNKVLKFWIVVFAVLLTPPAAFVAHLACLAAPAMT